MKDIPTEYIKMCENAVEIQAQWEPYAGDSYAVDGGIIRFDNSIFNINGWKPTGYKIIWLPRQDQLQEMVENEPLDCIDGIKTFWVDIDCPDYSWEQLWLAFVMKEKFNKVWDGTEWKLKILTNL